MGLDGALGRAQCVGYMLVGLAANDELEHFPLARRQGRDVGTNIVELDLLTARRFVMGDGPHRGRNIEIAGEKHDRQSRAKLAQASLKLRTTQSGYSHVKKNAARLAPTRQTIEQMLSRRIGRDLIACLLQTAFDRRSEGSIVVDHMHASRQLSFRR